MATAQTINKFLSRFGLRLTQAQTHARLMDLQNDLKSAVGSINTLLRLAMFHRQQPLIFIQIGANDGTSFDGLYGLVTKNRAEGLVVEPLKYYFNQLQQAYRDYPAIKPVNVALHKTERSMAMYQLDQTKAKDFPNWFHGLGSFDQGHLERKGIPREAMVEETVECMTVSELIKQHKMEDVHFIQIDVEGYDAEIIKMLDFSQISPTLIQFESHNLDAASRAAANQKLLDHNYQLFHDSQDTIAWKE